jgi:tight adherence protein B
VRFIFASDLFVILLFAAMIFIICYLNINRILKFYYDKTLGQREELFQYLDKLYIDTDRDRVSRLLMVLSFGVGGLIFLVLWPNILPGLVLGTAFAIGGWTLPKIIVKNMWEARCSKITNQMVDGMTIMANGVRSGLSVPQSMERIVQNIPGPLAQEFSLILKQIQLGRSVEEALTEFSERIPRPDVHMFVTSVNILKETGGNMAETFETITTTIRERQKIEKKIEALTAKGKTQAIFATSVPFVLLLIFFAVDPTYVMPLFTKPLGWFALFLMLGLQIIGGVMMKKIVTIKV